MIKERESLETINKCILCGEKSSEFKNYLYRDGYSLVQCKNCKLIFVNPRDHQQIVSIQYEEDLTSKTQYYKSTISSDLTIFKKRLELLESKMKVGNMLDIGCSVGTFIEVAQNRGWNVMGLEVNRESCEICRKKSISIYEGLFDEKSVECLKANNFNLVCMNDSIEHFSNPSEALKLIHDLLPNNGRLMLSTPNIKSILSRFFHIKPKEHLFYFNSITMRDLLKRNGFEIEICLELGRRREISAMQKRGSISKKLFIISRVLTLLFLDKIISIIIEKLFKDDLFIMAKKI